MRSLPRKWLAPVVGAVTIGWALVLFRQGVAEPPTRALVEWTMVNVNGGEAQGDAHLLRTPDGKHYLIDAGQDGVLGTYLRKRGIRTIDKVFVSHWHKDHYGGLAGLLASGVRVGAVIGNLPPRERCEPEKPWGCDYDDVQRVVALLQKKGIPLNPVQPGDRFVLGPGVTLDAIYASDGVHTPVGPTTVNDMSLVLKLTAGPYRALFTGDLNGDIAKYLAAQADLKATVLKVPHHGVDLAYAGAFFDRVAPQVALVPAQRSLWASDRARDAREYLKAKGVPTYVNGLEGHVLVEFYSNRLDVRAVQ